MFEFIGFLIGVAIVGTFWFFIIRAAVVSGLKKFYGESGERQQLKDEQKDEESI